MGIVVAAALVVIGLAAHARDPEYLRDESGLQGTRVVLVRTDDE